MLPICSCGRQFLSVVVHFDSSATINSSSAGHPLYTLLIIKLSPYSGIGAITIRSAILFGYQTRVRSSVDWNQPIMFVWSLCVEDQLVRWISACVKDNSCLIKSFKTVAACRELSLKLLNRSEILREVIKYYQLSGWRKLVIVKSSKADLSSVRPSSEQWTKS